MGRRIYKKKSLWGDSQWEMETRKEADTRKGLEQAGAFLLLIVFVTSGVFWLLRMTLQISYKALAPIGGWLARLLRLQIPEEFAGRLARKLPEPQPFSFTAPMRGWLYKAIWVVSWTVLGFVGIVVLVAVLAQILR